MTIGVDKKVFNVANSIVSTGQTAQEVMAQIPSVNVDINGNVTLRGATPQIYVDGMPTTLTLDQIPSDLIDKVEVITNPSAKYDASDANGGIINIVLKKNNTRGYNGGVSAGTDTRNEYNFAGDINVRLNKWNLFGNAAYRKRNQYVKNYTLRNNTESVDNEMDTTNSMNQYGSSHNPGHFLFVNIGATYNFNKKNMATLQGRMVNGAFNSSQPQSIDSIFYNGLQSNYSYLYPNTTNRNFKNFQGNFRYQHNFTDDGNQNLIVNVNYNRAAMNGLNTQTTSIYANPDYTVPLAPSIITAIPNNGKTKNLVFQADYTNPITKNSKIEAGIRGQINSTQTLSMQYTDSTGMASTNEILNNDNYLIAYASTKYDFTNQVYAAYGLFSSKLMDNKLAYQLGLRLESSDYKGTDDSIPLTSNVTHTFKTTYPHSLFPSVNLTYNITDAQDIQFSYSRKVQRPSFWQLLPIINYSNPYNLQMGNANLQPQFTSIYELSYDNNYGKNNSFVAGVYYRHSSNLLTVYQQIDSAISSTNPINTYVNASTSYTLGLELIDKTTIAKIWDLIGNINVYNTRINGVPASDLVINGVPALFGTLTNSQFSWFGKLNSTLRLPLGFTFQLTGQYHSKTVLPTAGGNNSSTSGGGGGRFGGNMMGSSQGYIGANSEIDAAASKIWRWGQGNILTLTASINDIFAGARYYSYSSSPLMNQVTYNLRQPRIVRFTVSYRFGKMDLKKKPQQQSDDNSDDMSGGMGGGM
jgi:outer membrane receptor protein involved in Fe transport